MAYLSCAFHACLHEERSHPQMARVHPVGHLSVVQRNCTNYYVVQRICTDCYVYAIHLCVFVQYLAQDYHSSATHLHYHITMVQRNCTFYPYRASHLHEVIIYVQSICTGLSRLCNAIAQGYHFCATQLHKVFGVLFCHFIFFSSPKVRASFCISHRGSATASSLTLPWRPRPWRIS